MIDHGESIAVVFAEDFQSIALFVGGLERGERAIAEGGDDRGNWADEDFANAQVIDEATPFIGDIDHIESLHITAVESDMVESFLDRPAFADAEEGWGHEATDGAWGVIEEGLSDGAFFGGEELEELEDGDAGEFFEEGGPIIGGHVIEDAGGLGMAHGFEDRLLGIWLEVFEDVGGDGLGEDPENHRLFFVREFGDTFCDIRWRPIEKGRSESGKVALLDQLFDFWADEISKHGRRKAVERRKCQSF